MKIPFLAIPACFVLLAPMAFAQSALSREDPQADNIQREVLHELRMLPYYSVFDDLKFQIEGSRVILSGDVVNPVTKSDAAASVKHIAGVTDVQDNIKVLPLDPDDSRIRQLEYRAIYGEPQLQKYGFYAVQGIHIIVDMGHVRLEGVVDNETDKNVANIRANSVPGVFSVQNNLQVASQQPR
jgi:hyperosmotically inducible periplasmic protein